jgi:hypothetical protein
MHPALGLPLLDLRIVWAGLAAKLVQDVLPGLLGRLLPVREARFLKSTHSMGLVTFIAGHEPIGRALAERKTKVSSRSGGVYIPVRREAINYPHACAMSRENCALAARRKPGKPVVTCRPVKTRGGGFFIIVVI